MKLVTHVLQAALHGRLLERNAPPYTRPSDASWYLRKQAARAHTHAATTKVAGDHRLETLNPFFWNFQLHTRLETKSTGD